EPQRRHLRQIHTATLAGGRWITRLCGFFPLARRFTVAWWQQNSPEASENPLNLVIRREGERSAGLAVVAMSATARAVLLDLEAVGVVATVLLGDVVAFLA